MGNTRAFQNSLFFLSCIANMEPRSLQCKIILEHCKRKFWTPEGPGMLFWLCSVHVFPPFGQIVSSVVDIVLFYRTGVRGSKPCRGFLQRYYPWYQVFYSYKRKMTISQVSWNQSIINISRWWLRVSRSESMSVEAELSIVKVDELITLHHSLMKILFKMALLRVR